MVNLQASRPEPGPIACTHKAASAYSLRAVSIAGLLVTTTAVAGPTGGNVVAGSAAIDASGTTTTINQQTELLAIDWDQFSIGAGESVNFTQPGSTSIALNRDLSGIRSDLMGSLTATGRVFLLNPAGILVGAGATIDTAGLLLSDLNIDDPQAALTQLTPGGTLTLSEQDLAAGGIEVLGSVHTTGPDGLTLAGQYLRINGSTLSENGPSNFQVGGAVVVRTDATGQYGVVVDAPIRADISGDGILYNVSSTPGEASIRTSNGNINININYTDNLAVEPINPTEAGSAYAAIGGNINRRIVTTTYVPAESDLIDSTVTDSLIEAGDEQDIKLVGDTDRRRDNNIDNLIADCPEDTRDNNDCKRQQAIKHYLGRLLIGGALPSSD